MKTRKSTWTIFNFTLKRVLWIAIFAILLLWCSTFTLLWFDDKKALGEIGVFGDMFGAVNALFSGFAFIGIIVSIRMQSEELELQRKELRETREEFSQQNKTLSLQRFENTFFQMIELHHKTVDRLNYRPNGGIHDDFGYILRYETIEGKAFLQKAHEVLNRCYEVISKKSDNTIIQNEDGKAMRVVNPKAWEQIQDGYNRFYYTLDFGSRLSHYFMTLYHIFKLIHQAEYLSDPEKLKYASIARAQLSQDELFILLYNSMYEYHGNPKFLFLMGRYKIHENFNFHDVDMFTSHMNIYYDLIGKDKDPFLEENPEPFLPSESILS